MIPVGAHFRGGKIVAVNKDSTLFAVYYPDDLGCKGRIYARMSDQKPTDEWLVALFKNGIQTQNIDGVWYWLIERVQDYPQIFSRMTWYQTNKASAWREK